MDVDYEGRARTAAAGMIAEHGWPRTDQAALAMIALGWLLGHKAGTDDTLEAVDTAIAKIGAAVES